MNWVAKPVLLKLNGRGVIKMTWIKLIGYLLMLAHVCDLSVIQASNLSNLTVCALTDQHGAYATGLDPHHLASVPITYVP